MKTAISVPDATFERVEERAAALRMGRSEFYVVAARRYLDELEAEELPRRIDEALALAGEDDSHQAAVAAGRAQLLDASGDW